MGSPEWAQAAKFPYVLGKTRLSRIDIPVGEFRFFFFRAVFVRGQRWRDVLGDANPDEKTTLCL